jgi:hypothetical protein
VESTYKPWTADKPALSFQDKGLLMRLGLHIKTFSYYLRVSQFEPGSWFWARAPSYLYRFAPEDQIRRFIADHLDWIPNLRNEIQKADPGFYGRAVDRLLDFLTQEIHFSKERQNEPQSLH